MERLKHFFSQRYVSAYADHPFKLGWRLLLHPKPAACSALTIAAAGLDLSPPDKLLEGYERKIYNASCPPQKPVLLVCGPLRNGTTLVAQFLIDTFDSAYDKNLTILFPRSPCM